MGEVNVTIDYYYDPFYRLTEADYSTGEYFWYTYDAVGNRLEQETHEETNTYVHDTANRLIEVDGVTYVWDDNGNLLSDGVSTYMYNLANRLTSVVQGDETYEFEYNGLGDRLRQTVNGVPTNYSLDINRGLTQVLTDDTSAYFYGLQRIGEVGGIDWSYYQGDAIGSVRQLIDSNSDATMAQSFEPFGAILSITGDETTNYGFTGEWTDATSLVNLRARYYAPESGRFITKDVWEGDPIQPMSINAWLYVYANPVNLSDPTGQAPANTPCTKGHKYCQLTSEQYFGVAIDVTHFYSSWGIADRILKELEKVNATEAKTFSVVEPTVNIPIIGRYIYKYSREYRAVNINQNNLKGVGLGIFMDFQYGFETFQRWDPRCFTKPPVFGGSYGPCSSFANEDLPSDYLGYVARAFGHSHANALSMVVGELGGGRAAQKKDSVYVGTFNQARSCSWRGNCDEYNPFNRCFLFKIFDPERGAFSHVPWPQTLKINSIGPGLYWERISDDVDWFAK